MPDDLVDLIAKLVSIDSVNPALDPDHPGETEIARFVAEWSQARGLRVEWLERTPGRPSVIVTAPGTGGGKNLLLNAHMDTVGVKGMVDPFTPRIENGRLYGRGAMDMKASLAACMLVVAEASTMGLAGDVILTAVADEEHDSIGTRETLEHLLRTTRIDAAIVTEPSDLQIQIAHRGFVLFEVEFEGKASHTSQPEQGVNALNHLGRFLVAVEEFDAELRRREPHPLVVHGSLQAVLASGGQELFTTPSSARVTLERRTVPGESAAAALAEVERLLATLVSEDPDVKPTVRTLLARQPFEVSPDKHIVRVLDSAVHAVTGTTSELVGAPYWTDAALIAEAGIPTVLFGPVGGGIHQAREWVNLESARLVRHVCRIALGSDCSDVNYPN